MGWIGLWLVLVVSAGGASALWWMRDHGVAAAALDWPWTDLLVVVAICVPFTVGNLGLRWLRWHFLLRHLGVRIPTRRSATLFVLLLPAVLTPFALGELLQIALLRPYTNRPARAGLLAWGLARFGDVCALAALALPGSPLTWLLLGLVLGSAGTLLATHHVTPGDSRTPADHAFALLLYVVLTVMAWALPAIALWLASKAVGTPWALLDAARSFAESTLHGAFVGSPGGVGVTGVGLIEDFGWAGASPTVAFATVTGFRAATVGLAVLLALSAWIVALGSGRAALLGREAKAQAHFDDLASGYEGEIPPHMRARLLDRKIAANVAALDRRGIGPGARGLDLGCGHGWYAIEMATRGYAMAGCDLTPGQVAAARRNAAARGVTLDLAAASVAALPYPDASFDFVYSINVLHHVVDPAQRDAAWREIARVLKPGGTFLLHEMNVLNPLFRLYTR